ncbi:MAG: hypothetical protein EP332_13585 [Bacteroidetes bacterium]|nr:MAG: hypothetical protein EP332_13585 [Bacteroidota bacterium]
MKKVLILFLLCFQLSALAQDTLFLKGQCKNYGDSVVLRWNVDQAEGLFHLAKSSFVIERKAPFNDGFQFYAKQAMQRPERWNLSSFRFDQGAVAAASLQKILALEEISSLNPAEHLNIQNELQFLWATLSFGADVNIEAANQANLRFCDKQLKQGLLYQYRAYAVGEGFISDTLYFFPGEVAIADSAANPEALEKEGEVALKWAQSAGATAYYLEKKEQSSKDFKPINGRLISANANASFLHYSDTVENYIPYAYRVLFIDAFGDLSAPSTSVIAMGRDKTPPPAIEGLRARELANGALIIQWQACEKAHGERGIALGIRAEDGVAYTPITKQLLDPGTDSFYWENPNQIQDIYLLAQVVDTAGNPAMSGLYYQYKDLVPPAKPQGLKAQVDSFGVVKLEWEMGTEEDLDGYLVFFSNDSNVEFSGIYNQPLPGNYFYDTLSLNMLNEEVYYRIQCVDKRFNRSLTSEIIKVKRPDYNAPVPPVFFDFSVQDSGITLEWKLSSSGDVEKQWLQRIGAKDTVWVELGVLDTSFTDKQVKPASWYFYRLYAEDDAQNRSPGSSGLYVQSANKHFKTEVKVVSAVYDSLSNTVELHWDYTDTAIRAIEVYRGPSRVSLSPMPGKIAGDQRVFIDRKVERNKIYFYAVKIWFVDGTETKRSIPVGVITGN